MLQSKQQQLRRRRHHGLTFSTTAAAAAAAAAAEALAETRAAALRDPELVQTLRDEAVAYATANGSLMMAPAAAEGDATKKAAESVLAVHAPCALLPARISRDAFERVRPLSVHFNVLVDKLSRDVNFLHDALRGAGKADPDFTGNLLRISRTVELEGVAQPLRLGIHRSDYMMHQPHDSTEPARALQIELNTISSSFGCLSTRISAMHRFLLERYNVLGTGNSAVDLDALVPRNGAMQGIAASLAAAHAAYGKPESTVVLMVVQPGETNSFDQRWVEYTLWRSHGIRVVRRSLQQVHDAAQLCPADGKLILDGSGDNEVSVAYFRAAYTPRDFTSSDQWDAVLKIEQSAAVKCPSVAYHLAGCKKMQQTLAQPGVVERYLDAKDAAALRGCFAGLWALDDSSPETQEVIEHALAHPDAYVMKPQREGGGNNFFGAQLVEQHARLSAAERSAYILMQRIMPRAQPSALMRNGVVSHGETLSELGIFSSYLGNGASDGDGGTLLNAQHGHLLRTKFSNVDEGGVASQHAVLDSPLLL
jgi:glutathione synthase